MTKWENALKTARKYYAVRAPQKRKPKPKQIITYTFTAPDEQGHWCHPRVNMRKLHRSNEDTVCDVCPVRDECIKHTLAEDKLGCEE